MNSESSTSASRSNRVLPWIGLVTLAVLAFGQLRLARRVEALAQNVAAQAVLVEQLQALATPGQEAGERPNASVSGLLPVNPNLALSQQMAVRLAALERRFRQIDAGLLAGSVGSGVPEYDPVQPVEEAPEPEPDPEQKRSWSAWQATGRPNTAATGDAPTAWAPLGQNTGAEWLRVGFAREVEVAEVRVRENFNAGAIVRITALMGGSEITLWEGTASPSKHLRDFIIRPGPGVVTQSLTIHLDTGRVSGWNEIDAVELVGQDGFRQWAVSAQASSSYGQRHAVESREYQIQRLTLRDTPAF